MVKKPPATSTIRWLSITNIRIYAEIKCRLSDMTAHGYILLGISHGANRPFAHFWVYATTYLRLWLNKFFDTAPPM